MEARANRSWLFGVIAFAIVGLLAGGTANGEPTYPPADDDYPFTTTATYTSDVAPIAVTDVQGDGIPDLVGSASDNLWTALGSGDGTFGGFTLAAASVEQPVVADFTGDGEPDVVGYRDPPGDADPLTLVLLEGEGGTFNAVSIREIGGASSQILTGDFDGDGDLDLFLHDSVVPIENAGLGPPEPQGELVPDPIPPQDPPITQYIGERASADVNGDGLTDLLFETR